VHLSFLKKRIYIQLEVVALELKRTLKFSKITSGFSRWSGRYSA
jgi:hypothetical protein